MFGLIKKIHEKDAIIKAHRKEISSLQDRLVLLNECNRFAEEQEQKLRKSLKQTKEEWQDKYTALYEKYLNLLERYEDVLKEDKDESEG